MLPRAPCGGRSDRGVGNLQLISILHSLGPASQKAPVATRGLLSVTCAEDVAALRAWARTRAVPASRQSLCSSLSSFPDHVPTPELQCPSRSANRFGQSAELEAGRIHD